MPAEVGGARVRALVARLSLDAGHPVSAELLIDDLWGEEPPRGALNALQRLVSRLRGVLGSDAVRSEPGGYRLVVQDVDALEFERLAKAGRRSLDGGDFESAARVLREAEGLWRGSALVGLGDAPFAGTASARLDDLRVLAAEDRIEAELALGRHAEMVSEVERLAAAHPLRERLQGQLMKVLYATGRQSDALAVYERVRGALDEELGIDPSAELAEIHVAVLRQAPELKPETRRHHAAAPLTTFVGRDGELRALRGLLEEARLVTIVGSGGAGKTRLALELVEGDAWFVELEPVADSTDLVQTVLVTLGIRDQGLDAFATLAEALRHRHGLLVLDNCEQIIDAAAAVAERLLADCPGLRILATSREPLGIAGERQYAIPPLGLPEPEASAGEALVFPAVQLFADRAASVRPGFTVTAGNVAPVVEICRSLDGMPLAIELAAARLRILSPAQIAQRLDDRFRLLTGGSRTAPPRHQTLRAVVEWSWGMLDEPERLLARRFSVFVGGASLGAVEEVCSGEGLPRDQVLDVVAALTEKSLLEAFETATGEMRYRMLETLRAYGVDRVTAAGETKALQTSHARYYLALAEDAEPRLRTGEQVRTLAVLRTEHPNLLAALRRALDGGDSEVAIRLCAALVWYWILQGARYDTAVVNGVLGLAGDELPTERAIVATVHAMVTGVFTGDVATGEQAVAAARAHLPDAEVGRHPLLALLEPIAAMLAQDVDGVHRELEPLLAEGDPWSQATALMFRGLVSDINGDATAARADLATAHATFERLGDRWGLFLSAQALGPLYSLDGDPVRAAAAYREALAHLEALGTITNVPELVGQIGHELLRAGDREGAFAEFTRALDLAERTGSPKALAWVTCGLGKLAADLDEARSRYEEALAIAMGDSSAEGLAPSIMAGLAGVEIRQGDLDAARGHLKDAVERTVRSSDMPSLATAAHVLAELALAEDEPERAATLLGTAVRVRGALDRGDPDIARIMAAVRERLGDAAYEKAFRQGADLTREDALAALA
ncbi:BTAD domain-containing putative transcriptional regulator [Actinomadura sp. 6N118]|uniref:BTAD domain-containing putative transcriptional regulator n=1 Tax=Actinomadura sp. 6N118 TaxID=3375151 RepID=UPI0037B1DFAC